MKCERRVFPTIYRAGTGLVQSKCLTSNSEYSPEHSRGRPIGKAIAEKAMSWFLRFVHGEADKAESASRQVEHMDEGQDNDVWTKEEWIQPEIYCDTQQRETCEEQEMA